MKLLASLCEISDSSPQSCTEDVKKMEQNMEQERIKNLSEAQSNPILRCLLQHCTIEKSKEVIQCIPPSKLIQVKKHNVFNFFF